MKKMYACLKCGFVHSGRKTKRVRKDNKGAGPGPGGFKVREFHGWLHYRICPECRCEQLIKTESDSDDEC